MCELLRWILPRIVARGMSFYPSVVWILVSCFCRSSLPSSLPPDDDDDDDNDFIIIIFSIDSNVFAIFDGTEALLVCKLFAWNNRALKYSFRRIFFLNFMVGRLKSGSRCKEVLRKLFLEGGNNTGNWMVGGSDHLWNCSISVVPTKFQALQEFVYVCVRFSWICFYSVTVASSPLFVYKSMISQSTLFKVSEVQWQPSQGLYWIKGQTLEEVFWKARQMFVVGIAYSLCVCERATACISGVPNGNCDVLM